MSDDGTSVGKITLDLEVKSDLEGQVSKVSENLGKKLEQSLNNSTKGMFDSIADNMDKSMDKVNNSLKSGLNSMKDNIKNTLISAFDIAKNISFPKFNFSKPTNENSTANNTATGQPTTRPPPSTNSLDGEKIKADIETASRVLETTNAQIDRQKEKIKQLQEAYDLAFNTTRKDKLSDDLLRAENRLNSLIAKSDKYGFKLVDLDDKLLAFKAAEEEAANNPLPESLEETTSSAERAGITIKSLADKVDLLKLSTKALSTIGNGSIGIFSKMSSGLKELGSKMSDTEKCTSRFHYSLGMLTRQFFTWMVIMPLAMKGLESLSSGLLADLKTNDQFNQSLNKIKTNLMVAFTPIFYAILPAINALMSALATATTYIASFISAIFGKTYQQSYQATQGLINAKQAMGAYGESAKKAAQDTKDAIQGLAGIDEINNLSKTKASSTDDTSKVPTLTQPSLDTSAVDSKMQGLADKFKEILGKIFDPMKEAWDKEGKNTIDALKYALGEIWDLAKDIGNTFLDVWDNGTGVRVCTDILKLLQTIFNIVGDIAKAFKTAWDTNNLGKQVVQAIFDALDDVLKLLIDIGNTFRDVWNSGLGVEICTNILEILKNIFTIIGQIAVSFKNAWDSGLGKQLMTDILNLLNGCLRVIKDITSSFSKAWSNNGDTICKGILLILDDIIGTISDIANKWADAWENNGAGDKLMDSLLSTLGKILTTVGDIGQGIRDSIGKAADTIFPAMIQFATDVSNGLGSITDGFKTIWDNGGKHLFDGLIQLAAQIGKIILQIGGQVFIDFGNLFKTLAPVIGAVADALGTVVDKITNFITWLDQCTPIVQILAKTIEALAIAFGVIKTVITVVTTVMSAWETACGIASVASEGFGIAIGALSGPIGWIVLAIAGLVAAGIALYENWDTVKGFLTGIWESIKNTAEYVWNGLKDFFSKWGTDILAFFVGGPVGLIVNEIAKHWTDIKSKTTEIWGSIKDWLSTKWDNIKTDATTKFDNIKTYIGQKWDNVKTDAATKWESIKNTLSQKWDNIKTTSATTWDAVKDYISKKWSEVDSDASTGWTTVSKTLSDKWNEITNISSTTWTNMKAYMSQKWNEINADIPALWDAIKTTLSQKWNDISSTSQDVWNGIVNFLNNTFSVNWSEAWTGLCNIVGKAFSKLEGMVKSPINAIIGFVNKLIDALNSIKIDIPDWVKHGVAQYKDGEFGGSLSLKLVS